MESYEHMVLLEISIINRIHKRPIQSQILNIRQTLSPAYSLSIPCHHLQTHKHLRSHLEQAIQNLPHQRIFGWLRTHQTLFSLLVISKNKVTERKIFIREEILMGFGEFKAVDLEHLSEFVFFDIVWEGFWEAVYVLSGEAGLAVAEDGRVGVLAAE
jgi:hypothetical protein